MAGSAILIASPVRNEAEHIRRMARSLAAQTVRPRAWVVVDDGSTDETWEILESLREEIPFLHIRRAGAKQEPLSAARDRLAAAAAPRAFNAALEGFDVAEFDFIGKLDGDLELPPDYFERLLAQFDLNPKLGIAGGDLVERVDDGWRRIAIPAHHVHGALKLYSRACFEAVGGVRNTLGWDTIDEVTARALGYHTRSYRDIVVKHHRHWGSADGTLRGRARHGRAAWILGYTPTWATVRSLKLMTVRPMGVSGLSFLYGYVQAAIVRTPRTDPSFRALMRAELQQRSRHEARQLIRRTPPTPFVRLAGD
jgi:glycosyltransferase involved in cell wall biosynthesis